MLAPAPLPSPPDSSVPCTGFVLQLIGDARQLPCLGLQRGDDLFQLLFAFVAGLCGLVVHESVCEESAGLAGVP